MKNINWIRKLTSRKFWCAVVGFVTPTMLAFGATDSQVTQVAAIIMAGGTLIAYIIGEGMADAGNTGTGEDPGPEEGLYSTSAIGFEVENDNGEEE